MANLFELKELKCKTCGEPLDIAKAQNGVIKCGVCDAVFIMPKDETPSAALDFIRSGEHDLDTCKFDDAYVAYSKAAELSAKEPEAYFGMALAEFKIQYLKDEVNNKLQPICHEVTDKKFADSANFLKAIRFSTDEQRAEYERKADEIEYIMTEFFKLKNSGIDYDCFICVKVSDDNGGTTEDSEFAHKIYRMLKKNSYEPFYSEAVLKNVTGADYEAHILYALASSETMLIVCFDEGYLRTKWVKNEYTRYLKLVNDEEKESDSITVVYKGKPIEKLPNRKGKLQGIDAGELDFSARILKFVESHTPEAKKRREEEAKRKSEESDALRKELAEQAELLKLIKDQINNGNSKVDEEELHLRSEAKKLGLKCNYCLSDLPFSESKDGIVTCNMCGASINLYNEIKSKHKQLEEKLAAERRAAEEQARIEAERKAAEEKARKEAERKAIIARDFEIENGVLKKYKGQAAEVTIPDGVTSIGEYAFAQCSNLTSITIPDGVISIDIEAFFDCSALKSITIPDSVTSIGRHAFGNCSSLTSIAIPDSVISIGYEAFDGCSGLTSITVGTNNTAYKSENNCLLTKDGKTLISGCNTSIIPDGVTSIENGAFSYRSSLTGIIIPDGVTSISGWAFYRCSSLKSITIPDRVTSIGWSAFEGCRSLKSINFKGTKKQWKAIEKGKKWDKDTGKYKVTFLK